MPTTKMTWFRLATSTTEKYTVKMVPYLAGIMVVNMAFASNSGPWKVFLVCESATGIGSVASMMFACVIVRSRESSSASAWSVSSQIFEALLSLNCNRMCPFTVFTSMRRASPSTKE